MAICANLSLQPAKINPLEEWVVEGDDLYFIFPEHGAGRFVSASVTQYVGSRDVLVVNGTAGGRLRAAKRGSLVFRFFSLGMERLSLLIVGEELGQLQDAFERFKCTRLYPAASPLAIQCHALIEALPRQFNLAHRSQLLRVAAAILSDELKNTWAGQRGFMRVEEQMAQTLGRLSVNDLVNLSVVELAAKFNCSRRNLNRLFQEHVGSSVIALKMEMRLLKAVSLLRNSDAKVISVAEQSGFNHLGLFNACFKRRFGVSPSEWRKRARMAAGPAPTAAESDPNCQMLAVGLCPWCNSKETRGIATHAMAPLS